MEAAECFYSQFDGLLRMRWLAGVAGKNLGTISENVLCGMRAFRTATSDHNSPRSRTKKCARCGQAKAGCAADNHQDRVGEGRWIRLSLHAVKSSPASRNGSIVIKS